MNQKAQAILERGKPWVEVAESDDPQAIKTRAYEEIAKVIIEASETDPGLSQIEIGKFYKKSADWVSRVKIWYQNDRDRSPTPFSNPRQREHDRRYKERQVPTQHRDKVEMAKTLLDDPQVLKEIVSEPTKSKTARKVRNAVTAMNAKERKEAIKREQQKARDQAMPLPVMLVRLMVRMREWAMDMSGLYPDVVAIPDDHPQRAEVGKAASDLRHQAHRWELALMDEDESVCPLCSGEGKVAAKALAEVVELPVIEAKAR
jgi:hypothetical protein